MSRTAKRLTILELMKAVGNRADEMADDRLRQYCLQILNSLRSGKPEIEVRAVGQGSSYQSAEILEGCICHIESQSMPSRRMIPPPGAPFLVASGGL